MIRYQYPILRYNLLTCCKRNTYRVGPLKVFISYSRSDLDTVKRFAQEFYKRRIPFWIDIENIPGGAAWREKIHTALKDCDVMVLFVSPKSMMSRQVAAEWQNFDTKNKPIIPVLIEPTEDMNYGIEHLHYIDCVQQPHEDALNDLLRALLSHRNGQQPSYPDAPPPPDFNLNGKNTLKLIPFDQRELLSSVTKQTGRLDPSVVDRYQRSRSEDVLMRLINAKQTDQDLSVRLMPDNIYVAGRTDGNFQPHIDLSKFKAVLFGVSREHAQFNIRDRRLYITDLKSTNGTKINGRPIPPERQYLLQDSDMIQLGGLSLIISFETE